MARALCGLVAVRVDGLLPPYTLVEEGTDRLLGAHLLGIHAEEVINLFALAIRAGIPAKGLKRRVYAYPTSTSDIRSML